MRSCPARRRARDEGRPGAAGGDVPGLLHRRKGEGEPRAQARPVALGPDAAPERFNYPLADGKAQARVAPLFLGLDPGELAEQVRQALGGDASALVGYRHRDVDPLPHGGHPDDGRLRRVPGRVDQQVAQHLRHAQPVGHDPGQVRRKVDLDVVLAPAAAEAVAGLADQYGHVGRFR